MHCDSSKSPERLELPWRMIGGLAVDHWAEELLATADVDLIIVAEQKSSVFRNFLAAADPGG
jgi:hypothetical protein